MASDGSVPVGAAVFEIEFPVDGDGPVAYLPLSAVCRAFGPGPDGSTALDGALAGALRARDPFARRCEGRS